MDAATVWVDEVTHWVKVGGRNVAVVVLRRWRVWRGTLLVLAARLVSPVNLDSSRYCMAGTGSCLVYPRSLLLLNVSARLSWDF